MTTNDETLSIKVSLIVAIYNFIYLFLFFTVNHVQIASGNMKLISLIYKYCGKTLQGDTEEKVKLSN